MRQLEQAGLARAFRGFDSEQFCLKPVGLHRGAIDGDEGVGGAARTGMDQACHNFLARASGAGNQHPAVGGGDLLDQHPQLGDGGRQADQFALIAALELQFLYLPLQPRRFQRTLHHMQQAVGLERLFDEVIGALLDRRDGGFNGAVARDHHHRKLGLLALDDIEHLDAVQPAALQPDVQDHQLGAARAHGRQRRFTVARGAGGIALVGEDARDQVADIGLIIDDQNFRRDQRSVLAHLPVLCLSGLAAVSG